MYALPNKTQHKLIAKVRGGISQKLDNFSSSTDTGGANISSNNSLLSLSLIPPSPSSSSTPSHPFKPAASSSFRESTLSRDIDDIGFNAELSCMPQPIFHPTNQNGSKPKSSLYYRAQKQQYITPEHNEMIKYVEQSWKGVERDYKKSVNNFINNLDLNNSSDHISSKSKQMTAKKKAVPTTSSPLLLSGSYHHSSSITKDSSSSRQDSFRPFDLEAFWGNRILKRLTEEL